MFTTPIRSVKLQTLQDVKDHSEYVVCNPRRLQYVFCQNNGQIVFTDEYGNAYVTPYRTEIHDILRTNNYTECHINVPYSNPEVDIPVRYTWLQKMAELENWSTTYESAYQHAQAKGIKPVTLDFGSKQIRYREITNFYPDKNTYLGYHPMIKMYLLNDSAKNIGTYILVDEQTILICDEYGRTFQVTAQQKATFNTVVNTLIESGYRHNTRPNSYVQPLPPDYFVQKE